MRIAQVFIDLRVNTGGASKVVHLLSDELGRDNDVHVVIPGSVEEMKGARYELFQLPPDRMMSRDLADHLDRHDYDIVHVHGYNTFLPYKVVKARRLNDYRIVFTPHYHPTGNHPWLLRKMFDGFHGAKAFEGSDIVTVLSDVEKEMIMAHGVGAARIRKVPNPIDPDMLRTVDGAVARKNYELRDRVILFVGRLDRNKGLPDLLEAFGRLKAMDDELSLMIVGKDISMQQELESIVRRDSLKDVHITGRVDREMLLSLYSCADVLVLPSDWEAFGMVLVEAMAQGLPVVATDVGGVPELLKYGDCGLLVPYGDEGKLERGIWEVLEDEIYRKTVIGEGRERVRDFLPGNVADMYRKIYREVLDK